MVLFWRMCFGLGVCGLGATAAIGWELTVFDVARGDALLVRHGETCLWIDAGQSWAAERLRNEWLVYRRRCKEHLILVTHLDVDHVGGAQLLARIQRSRGIFIPDVFFDSRFLLKRKQYLSSEAMPISRLPSHLKSWVEVLWPVSSTHSKEVPNDLSLVLRVWNEDKSVCALLTGDITQKIESQLLNLYPTLRCSILKAAHHGSKTSTHLEFLRRVNPQVVLISAGWNDPYGHPHPHVMNRLNRLNILAVGSHWMGKIQIKIKHFEFIDLRSAVGDARIRLRGALHP